ncbi:MAG: acetyl-CoA acetyltransferase family protein [Verrucomicrobiales bacterium]|jgi:acetyl-CoA acetyltransferase family protein
MKKPRLVIIDGIRTPFARMGTSLASLSAADLGTIAVRALLARTGVDPATISETILGCVAQPADAANIARVVALRAGIPEHVPAMTVHRNCASGMESVTTAFERMVAGSGDLFVVGGTESMSNVPLLFHPGAAAKFASLSRARSLGARAGAVSRFKPRDFAPLAGLQLGLTDPVVGMNMGDTAELLARELGISRQEQDAYAVKSHLKAVAGREALREEICPVFTPGSQPEVTCEDNGIRLDSSVEKLSRLQPVFDRVDGTLTAGNASQITDGAVALLVGTEAMSEKIGKTPLGYLTAHAYTGCDPRRMGLGPVSAIGAASEKAGLTLADADVVEINEAFAVQVLAVLKQLETHGGVPMEHLNPNGGAIALGHPVGATGARLILTCLNELKRRNGHRALAALCVGGGQGGAVWLERSPL